MDAAGERQADDLRVGEDDPSGWVGPADRAATAPVP